MNVSTESILRLPTQHQTALRWFLDHRGKTTPWPNALPDGTLLATRAKGIYKPAWSEYALSVRQTLEGPYADREPITRLSGSWVYLYHQEGHLNQGNQIFTNEALLACLRDRVPIGVMRQVSVTPMVEYGILGLALVTGWDRGYFVLEGIP